jgi:hypothetical protein
MEMSRPAPGRTSDSALLTALLAGESFWPSDPASFHELGLTEPFLEAMVCRLLRSSGNLSGRTIAGELCIPFRMIEGLMDRLKNRRMVIHCGSASMNDYVFGLTDEGRRRAEVFHAECAYVGPAPVPLADYVISVEAQAICDQPVRREELEDAFYNVSVSEALMDMLGPAINSGSGLFLYGAPGNGKSTLARCLTSCFGQEIWIPYAIMDGREIITLFDPAYHHEAQQPEDRLAYDDFGSGQARLKELFEVPPDVLKFDLKFVQGLPFTTAQHRATIQSLIRIVKDLNVVPLAEGVETVDEASVCFDLGFELAQGYLFGRAEAASHWINA